MKMDSVVTFLNGEFIASICQGFCVILEKIGSVEHEKLNLTQKLYSCLKKIKIKSSF